MRVVDNLDVQSARCPRQSPSLRLLVLWAPPGEKTHLDEGLDLAALGELLRTHALGHLEGVALDAGDDGVGVWPLLGALVELLDDDDLVSRLAALEDDRDLAEAECVHLATRT